MTDANRLNPTEVAEAFVATHLQLDPSNYLRRRAESDQPCGCALGAMYLQTQCPDDEVVMSEHNDRVSNWAMYEFGPEYVRGVNHGFCWSDPSEHEADYPSHTGYQIQRFREGWWDGAMSRHLALEAIEAARSIPLLTPTT